MPRRTVLIVAGLLVLDVGLTVLMFGHAWAHPTVITIGRRTDTPYTVWAMAWVARALTHGQSPLSTHALSWPGGVNLMTNATVNGLATVLAPVTWIWGPLVAFNVAATAALALTAWSAQLVLWRTGLLSWPGVIAGGLFAGFGPQSIGQQSGAHLHVTAAFLVPPLLFGIGRLVSGTARYPGRWGVAIGVMAAMQLMIGEEMLAITAITAAIAVAVVAVLRLPVAWAAIAQALAAATVVFMLLATWPLWVQFAGNAHINGPIQHGVNYPNDLTGFVVPSNHMAFTGGWVATSFSSEGGVYLGIPVLIAAIAAVVRWWREPLIRVAGLTAAVLAILSFGDKLAIAGHRTAIPMPWDLLGHLPVLESLIPVRFGIVLDLAAGAFLALAMDTLVIRGPRRRRHGRHARPRGPRVFVPALVGAACLFPIVPKLPFPTSRWAIPAGFRHPGMTGIPDNALIVLGPYPVVTEPEVEMWLAAAGDRWRTYGGSYFVPDAAGNVTIGGLPPASAVVETRIAHGGELGPGEAQRIRDEFAHDRVRAVVIGPMDGRDRVIAFWTRMLGAPRVVGGLAVFSVSPG